jgi:hypothetical protein
MLTFFFNYYAFIIPKKKKKKIFQYKPKREKSRENMRNKKRGAAEGSN